MKLETWIDEQNMSKAEFGRRIGRSRSCVLRYCTGDRLPGRRDMQEIAWATEGAVTANDFYGDPSEAAK